MTHTYSDITSVFNEGKLARYEDIYDLDAIKNSLINIFTIQQNEVPGKPDFGNPLKRDVFDLFDNTSESTLFSAVQNAVEKWEPRVTITGLKINLMPEYNRVIVDLRYKPNLIESVENNLLIPLSHNNFTYLNGRTEIEFVSDLVYDH